MDLSANHVFTITKSGLQRVVEQGAVSLESEMCLWFELEASSIHSRCRV